jgi:hypothetical protein
MKWNKGHKTIVKDMKMSYRLETIKTGITFGTALAIVISWPVNKSVLWAIFHGILSWIYVIYYVIFY